MESRPRWVLPAHILAFSLIQATQTAVMFQTALIARKQFNATDFQTVLITAAPNVLFCLSIFWNDLFTRRRFGSYLLIYWAVASLPLAFMGLADSIGTFLALYLIASVGASGYHPASGDLLRALYPSRVRGRIYSLLWGVSLAAGAVVGMWSGGALNADPERFRVLFPVSVVVQLLGVLLLARIASKTGHSGRRVLRPPDDGATAWARLVGPVLHMGAILKADPVFARYEAAYMTYGVGWMVAHALLPILITDRLELDYEAATNSALVMYLVGLLLALAPAGWLMDRLGAVRSTALSFLLLTGYPLGLLVAWDAPSLAVISLWYGLAHAGASVGWMLGPVALAPTPDKVPAYVAIHATLVGVRGAIFQGIGVAIYGLTGSFVWPLLLGAAAYVWSAWQMLALHRRMKAGGLG